jgi:hypothetical protein
VIELWTKKTKFGHEDVHAHILGTTIGLATQPIQDMGVDSARDLWYDFIHESRGVNLLGENLK